MLLVDSRDIEIEISFELPPCPAMCSTSTTYCLRCAHRSSRLAGITGRCIEQIYHRADLISCTPEIVCYFHHTRHCTLHRRRSPDPNGVLLRSHPPRLPGNLLTALLGIPSRSRLLSRLTVPEYLRFLRGCAVVVA